MISALPFLAMPLAVAYRAIPGATLGLVLGGAAFMVAATLTTALEGFDGHVSQRVVAGEYVESVAAFVGLDGSAAALPFVVAIVVAAAAAAAVTPWQVIVRRDAVAAVVSFLAWLLIADRMHSLLQRGTTGEATALLAAAATAAVVALVYRFHLPLQRAVHSGGSER